MQTSVEYFERKAEEYANQTKIMENTIKTSDKSLKASYLVALRIAKNKSPHTIGEKLLLPVIKDVCNTMFGSDFVRKIENIPLSNDTIQRRIKDMSLNVSSQVITRVKFSPFFSLQTDESTDIEKNAQLLTYVRYVFENEFNEELLFCKPLETYTTGGEIFEVLNSFFVENDLIWSNCVSIISDKAGSMMGKNKGLMAKVREVSPGIQWNHCIIHKQVLASKNMSNDLNLVLDIVVKSVNFIKSSALNTRLFRILCDEMGSEHKNLLMHTEVRWLSRGKVLQRLFELRDEVFVFLNDKQNIYAKHFNDSNFMVKFAYLSDIYSEVNKLNLSLQANASIINSEDKISAFVKKT
jgi:hypothetical protein